MTELDRLPRVSICVPTYNSVRFLPEAIESALGQNFADFELIVCDNASIDGTREACLEYKDPRFKYHRFETLVGQGGNWNRCVALATGEFVALLHADDVYRPEFLATRVNQFEAFPDAGMAFGAVELIDEASNTIGKQSFADVPIASPPAAFYGELLLGCVINPASIVVRRACYAAVGTFNEQRLWGIDWDMWLRVSAIAGVSYSPSIASGYRIHGSSGSATGLLGPRYLSDDLAVLESALQRISQNPSLDSSPSTRQQAIRAFSLRALAAAGATCEAGLGSATLRALGTAIRLTPSLLVRPTVWALAVGAATGPSSYRLWKRFRSRAKTA